MSDRCPFCGGYTQTCKDGNWAREVKRQKARAEKALDALKAATQKDLEFLREMKSAFHKAREGWNGGDKCSYDHVESMIDDWIHELEEAV